jgi:hypothetical protein
MRVAALNELRCNLQLALPGAIGLFSRPDSPITLAFLRRFPTAARVAWLSPVRWAAWLRSVNYTGGIPADALYAHLTDAAPGPEGAEAEARGAITVALVDTIEMLNTRIAALEAQIADVFAAHPDRAIFASLPRSGTVRAANLLAEIGDCRARFPTDVASPRSLGCHRRRASRTNARKPCSAGRATRSCASPSSTSPMAPAPSTRGPPTSIGERSSGAAATTTPCASSPEPGSALSGAAGKTASPSTRPSTPAVNCLRLDIGHS